MSEWKTWNPEYDGHVPDDWDGGIVQIKDFRDVWQNVNDRCFWVRGALYRYRAKPNNAAYGKKIADLTEQCLALPQADREALIEALQKPQRDWAWDVWEAAYEAFYNSQKYDAAPAVIRSMCRPKEVELDERCLAKKSHEIWCNGSGDWPKKLGEAIKEAINV